MSSLGFYMPSPHYRSLLLLESVLRVRIALLQLCCTWGSHICLLFQACTGIDNIAEAITLLELNNWDLVVSFTHSHCSTLGCKAASAARSKCRLISSWEMFPAKRTCDHRPCARSDDVRVGWLDGQNALLSTAVNRLKCWLPAPLVDTFIVCMAVCLVCLTHLQHHQENI